MICAFLERTAADGDPWQSPAPGGSPMSLSLEILGDGSVLLTSRDYVGADETFLVMRRLRALIDESPRRLVCDLRAVVEFDPAADSFSRGMLSGTNGRILEIVIVGGPYGAMRAAGATAAFLGAPFVFCDTLPSWAAPSPSVGALL
jgi:hypothetical protein